MSKTGHLIDLHRNYGKFFMCLDAQIETYVYNSSTASRSTLKDLVRGNSDHKV